LKSNLLKDHAGKELFLRQLDCRRKYTIFFCIKKRNSVLTIYLKTINIKRQSDDWQ